MKPVDENEAATFVYASSNKAVSTVNANGKTKALADGTAKIGVKTHNGKIDSVTIKDI